MIIFPKNAYKMLRFNRQEVFHFWNLLSNILNSQVLSIPTGICTTYLGNSRNEGVCIHKRKNFANLVVHISFVMITFVREQTFVLAHG